MSAIRLLPVANTLAELDLATPGTNLDTVVEANPPDYEGAAGNQITIETAADGTGAGSFTVSGTAVTFHYESGVTTVEDFETELAADAYASALIRVKTAGTAANVLADPGDTFSATNLAGGGATASAAPTLDSATAGVKIPHTCDQALILLRNVDTATGTTKTAAATLWGFSPVTERWYEIGALSDGSSVAETSSDAINYAELVVGLRGFSRLYCQIDSLGGAGTEVEVYAHCTPAEPVSR